MANRLMIYPAIFFLSILMLSGCTTTNPQADTPRQEQVGLQSTSLQVLRPASSSEFVGYWRVLLFTNEASNRVKNIETGYTDPCLFFIHKENHNWLSISFSFKGSEEETRRRCMQITKQDIDIAIQKNSIITTHQWKGNLDGMFVVSDGLTGYDRQMWHADYATHDISINDYFDFKKGDIVMTLALEKRSEKLYSIVLVWRMALRPVPVSPLSVEGASITEWTVKKNRPTTPFTYRQDVTSRFK